MTATLRILTVLLATLLSTVAVAQSITIAPVPADASSAPKAAKSQTVSLVGIIDIIPMFGAQVVIRSNNFGQITLLPQTELAKTELEQIERWVSQRVQITVRGTMITSCTKDELKRDIMGCRTMDRSKPITLARP